MARSDTLYASPGNLYRRQRIEMFDGDIRTLSVDLNAVAADRGTTATSAVWETDDSDVISDTGAGLSSGVASVVVTALNIGSTDLSCTATFADTTTATVWWHITVKSHA